MILAPLQLLDYWATSIHMDACSDYDIKSDSKLSAESLKVVPFVKQLPPDDENPEGSRWLIGLSIAQKPIAEANMPYTFSVEIQGVVFVSPQITGERLERVINANGPAMLFGAAREMIRAATGRGPNGPVIIPSTNFLPGPKEADTKDTQSSADDNEPPVKSEKSDD